MKKIISLLLLISMIFSMSVISYSEDIASEDLKLEVSYVTSKYIFLDFNEAILFDDAVKEKTTLTIKDDTTPVAFTVTSKNENKSFVLEVTGGMDIEEAYTLNIPVIYNTDKTKYLFGTQVDISFDVYWNDNFDEYQSSSDLSAKYVTYAQGQERSDLNILDLVTEPGTNNKKMAIKTEEKYATKAGAWINASKWSASDDKQKYFTFEVDLEAARSAISGGREFVFDYFNNTNVISNRHSWRYAKTDYNYRMDADTGLFFTNWPDETAWKDLPCDKLDGINTFLFSTKKLTDTDSLDIFVNSAQLLHKTGTLKTDADGNIYGCISPHFYDATNYGLIYVDNWKIYDAKIAVSDGAAYSGTIPTELIIVGELEAGNTVSINIADETNPKVTTSFEWYKGADLDASLEDTSKWTPIINNSKDYTVKAEDEGNYIVCKVKKVLKIDDVRSFEIFNIITSPLVAPYAPECKGLDLIYTKGETSASLKADYKYDDANGDEQKGTVIKWEESVDNTNWTALSETTDTLDVTDVINKYIKCTVTVKNDGTYGDKAEPVSEIYVLPFEPTVTYVSISGTTSVGSLLQADYKYDDANDDKEKGSKFIWYRKSGTTETTVLEDSLAYVVQAGDRGYSIGFKIIPKNEVYPMGATEYRSNEIAIPEASSTPSSSGSSVSFSGSYTATVKPATKDDESKDNEKVLAELKENTKTSFADIKNHWAENEISSLSEKGIVKGRENGFEPDAMITRAEWLTLLLRGIDEEASSSYKGIFNDVKDGEWYTQAVEKAYSLGLVSGDGKSFNPNGIITREQMAKMAVLVYEYKNGEIKDSKDIDFTDKDNMSDWAEEYVKKAVGAGLMNGVTENEFSFSSSATRAQACVLLSRIINSLK